MNGRSHIGHKKASASKSQRENYFLKRFTDRLRKLRVHYIKLHYITLENYFGRSKSNFKDHYGDAVIKQCQYSAKSALT